MSYSMHINISIYVDHSEIEDAVIARICDDCAVTREILLMDCESYASLRKVSAESGEETEHMEDARQLYGWNAQVGDSVGEMGSPVWLEAEWYMTSDEYTEWVLHSGECQDPEDSAGFIEYIIDNYLSL